MEDLFKTLVVTIIGGAIGGLSFHWIKSFFDKGTYKSNKFHDQQIQVINQFYSSLSKLNELVAELHPTPDMNGEFPEVDDLRKFLKDFKSYFYNNQLYFSSKSKEEVKLILTIIDHILKKESSVFHARVDPESESDEDKELKDLYSYITAFKKQILEITSRLEVEFEKILGKPN